MSEASAEPGASSAPVEAIPQYFDGMFRQARVTAVEDERVLVSISDTANAEVPRDEFDEAPELGTDVTVYIDSTIPRRSESLYGLERESRPSRALSHPRPSL